MSAPLPALLKTSDVLALLGVSRVTLWVWRRKGEFPAPIRIGANTIRWREDIVRAWLAKRVAA